jgi:xanthine dehydrogenase accessory factor
MEVFVAPLDTEINRRLVQAAGDRALHALTTDLDTGVQRLFDPDDRPADLTPAVDGFLDRAGFGEAAELVEQGDRRIFAQILGPPVHLILVGAVHLGQVVAELALTAGFRVTVVDPRRAFATPERFPRVVLRYEWPSEALAELGLDRRTAVVTLSHDAKIDEPALAAALRSDCFYIGALGGRKSQAARRERLRDGGFDARALERIHGPVGLDIGARTAPEIAVSIVAEIIGAWRGGTVTGRHAKALRTEG